MAPYCSCRILGMYQMQVWVSYTSCLHGHQCSLAWCGCISPTITIPTLEGFNFEINQYNCITYFASGTEWKYNFWKSLLNFWVSLIVCIHQKMWSRHHYPAGIDPPAWSVRSCYVSGIKRIEKCLQCITIKPKFLLPLKLAVWADFTVLLC